LQLFAQRLTRNKDDVWPTTGLRASKDRMASPPPIKQPNVARLLSKRENNYIYLEKPASSACTQPSYAPSWCSACKSGGCTVYGLIRVTMFDVNVYNVWKSRTG